MESRCTSVGYFCQYKLSFHFWWAIECHTGGKVHLHRRRKHELSAFPGSVYQVAELLVAIIKPATVDHWANDVGDGAGGQQGRVKGLPCRYHIRKSLQSLPVQVAVVETTLLASVILHSLNQVARLHADLLFAGLPAHPKVFQVG